MTLVEAERRVQRLHLTAPDATLAGRAVRLLDDALRTASLPDAGGRLVFIRRVRLARFDADISPQALALAIERHLQSMWSRAVHVSDAGVRNAEAVWFRDPLEAHALLALRALEDAPADEWFWPLAVPAIVGASGRGARLRAIVTSLAQRPEAPAALPAFVQHVVARSPRHAPTLIDSLTDSDGETLTALAPPAARAVLSLSASRDPWTPARLRASHPLHAIAVTIERGALTPLDTRVRWIVAMLIASGAVTIDALERDALPYRRAERIEVDPPTPSAEAIVASHDTPASDPRGGAERAANAASYEPPRGTAAPPAPESAHREDRSTYHVRAPTTAAPGALHDTVAAPTSHAPSDIAMPLAQDPWPDGAITAAGGLLFLVPVLERLGYAAWLADTPVWAPLAIERRVFAMVCARVGLPRDDPAWALTEMRLRAKAPQDFCAPDRWVAQRSTHPTRGIADRRAAWRRTTTATGTRLHDASGLLLAAWRGHRPRGLSALIGHQAVAQKVCANPAPLSQAVANAWLTACRRWLRRYARIGLATLVTRPARLTLTPTHADVELELTTASVSVRRAGLDLDPGWVPWLGRVVAFHYRKT